MGPCLLYSALFPFRVQYRSRLCERAVKRGVHTVLFIPMLVELMSPLVFPIYVPVSLTVKVDALSADASYALGGNCKWLRLPSAQHSVCIIS